MWQDFGSRVGPAEVTLWEASWSVPPSSTELVLDGSKMDLLLAKAEHISDGGKTAEEEEEVPTSSLSRQDFRK